MGVGDTISGSIRIIREEASGDTVNVFGPYSHNQLDQRDNLSEATFVNPTRHNPAPNNVAKVVRAPDAVFTQTEVLRAQHQASSLSEAVDYDADEYQIEILDVDLNRGSVTPQTLTVDDQELSSNPTSSTSEWVTFFEVTVPDGHRYHISGYVNLAVVENA